MNNYFKDIGGIILTILWFFASQYMSSSVFVMLRGLDYAKEHTFLITFVSYIICLLPFWWIEKNKREFICTEYKVKAWGDIPQCIGYGLLLWLASSLLNGLLLPFFPTYTEEIGSLFVTSEPVLRFVVLVIGAPVVEEYLFRGKVQGKLTTLVGPNLAILGQGILFGMIHPFGLQKIYASFLGMGLGYVREKKGSLLASTIVHMTINGIAWLLASFIG